MKFHKPYHVLTVGVPGFWGNINQYFVMYEGVRLMSLDIKDDAESIAALANGAYNEGRISTINNPMEEL